MWRWLGWAGAALAVVGCAKSDCEKSCESVKECPNAPPVFASIPCDDACAFQEEQSEAAGCLAEFDAFNACGAAHTDRACESGTCSAEALAWSSCLDPN